MADIALRFHKDMLVLSSSVSAALERQGVDAARDLEFMNLVEPDSIQDILRLERPPALSAWCWVRAILLRRSWLSAAWKTVRLS